MREAPWHGLGNRVEHALSSDEALKAAELDRTVIQKPILTEDMAASELGEQLAQNFFGDDRLGLFRFPLGDPDFEVRLFDFEFRHLVRKP